MGLCNMWQLPYFEARGKGASSLCLPPRQMSNWVHSCVGCLRLLDLAWMGVIGRD